MNSDLCCSCSSCCSWSSFGRRWWLSCARSGTLEQMKCFLCSRCCLSACSHSRCCLHCGKTRPSSPWLGAAHRSAHYCRGETTLQLQIKPKKEHFHIWAFLCALKLLPIVACMAAAAAMWFSWSSYLAVGGGEGLHHSSSFLCMAIPSCSISTKTKKTRGKKSIKEFVSSNLHLRLCTLHLCKYFLLFFIDFVTFVNQLIVSVGMYFFVLDALLIIWFFKDYKVQITLFLPPFPLLNLCSLLGCGAWIWTLRFLEGALRFCC